MRGSNLPVATDNAPQRIKVGKRREGSGLGLDEGIKNSISIAEAYEHEKAMAQSYR